MVLCIGPTPAAQRVMVFRKLVVDAVNRASQTVEGIAGKSINVAKVLHSLGEQVVATGFVGGKRGADLVVALEAKGIETDFVNVAAPTRQCTTVIDQAAGTITELVEESQPVPATAYEELHSIIRRRITGCQAVVMSGTITPGGPSNLYLSCTEAAHKAGALPVVDAQGTVLLEALKGKPGLVKPNRAELAATVSKRLKDEASVIAAMRELYDRGASRIVVTAGKDPSLAFDGRTTWRISSPHVAAVNPIGSGDSFTAALVSRLLRGHDLGEACRWGAATGTANALTLLAGEVDASEVNRLVRQVTVQKL